MITPNVAGFAQDGSSYVTLSGEIHQTFDTIPGDKYQVNFYVSHMESPHNPSLNQEGQVEIYSTTDVHVIHEVFGLYRRPPTRSSGSGLQSTTSGISWQFHQYIFLADDVNYTIVLRSVGENGGTLLDNVQVCDLHV